MTDAEADPSPSPVTRYVVEPIGYVVRHSYCLVNAHAKFQFVLVATGDSHEPYSHRGAGMSTRMMQIECTFCGKTYVAEASQHLSLTCGGCGGGNFRIVKFWDSPGLFRKEEKS